MINKDFYGGDFKSIKVKSESECQQLCKKTDKCTKFTYLNNHFPDVKRRGECNLKTGKLIDPTDLNGVISGQKDCGNSFLIHYCQATVCLTKIHCFTLQVKVKEPTISECTIGAAF